MSIIAEGGRDAGQHSRRVVSEYLAVFCPINENTFAGLGIFQQPEFDANAHERLHQALVVVMPPGGIDHLLQQRRFQLGSLSRLELHEPSPGGRLDRSGITEACIVLHNDFPGSQRDEGSR